jgi:hypothetical protein
MDRDEEASEPLSATAEAVLAAVRRSVDVVQEFLESSARQATVIRSLETELDAVRQHVDALQGETARLRVELTAVHGDREIETLIEEQNVLAHMFVASDRLGAARTPREAIDIGIEVLHNLAGVHSYAVWIRPRPGAPLRLVAPAEARFRAMPPDHALVARALDATAPVRRHLAGDEPGVPVAIPLLLDGVPVGVIEVRELVPQVGPRLGRLQLDLLQFLADRLAPAMCRASLSQAQPPHDAWERLAAVLPTIEETTP